MCVLFLLLVFLSAQFKDLTKKKDKKKRLRSVKMKILHERGTKQSWALGSGKEISEEKAGNRGIRTW